MWLLVVIALLAVSLLVTALVAACFRAVARQEEHAHDISEAEAEAMTRPQGNVYVLHKPE